MSRGERYLTLSQAKHQHTHGPGGCLRSTLSCTRPRSQATQPDRSQAKVICAGLARHGPSLPHALSSEVAVGWHRLLSQAKHAGAAPRTWAHHRASAEFPRLAVPRHPIACDGRPFPTCSPPLTPCCAGSSAGRPPTNILRPLPPGRQLSVKGLRWRCLPP